MNRSRFPYDPASLPRERLTHYIAATGADERAMLDLVGKKELRDLFDHLPASAQMDRSPKIGPDLPYEELADHLEAISEKNADLISYLDGGLPVWTVPAELGAIASIRELTTSYTPYQPERSQGTLQTLWIWQSVMRQLTGFEAVNSSLYDRSSALFEGIQTAVRLTGHARAVLMPGLERGDVEVLRTLAEGTALELASVGAENGQADFARLADAALAAGPTACLVFPQVHADGTLTQVHALTDLAHRHGAKAVGVIDPMHLAPGGLLPPDRWGEKGADVIVGEGQHLALAPNGGGPGLGIFAVRHHAGETAAIRATAGRYVGQARDAAGRECKVMVLSTREQHIRREKANSNICSNEAFIATLAGASLLLRGDKGLETALAVARGRAKMTYAALGGLASVTVPSEPFLQKFTVRFPESASSLRAAAAAAGFALQATDREAGCDVTLSFTDHGTDADLERFLGWIRTRFGSAGTRAPAPVPVVPDDLKRKEAPGIPRVESAKVLEYYRTLGSQNVSPDSACYPLGSCTMKYNPYINDWAAGLGGFQRVHPLWRDEDSQGNLEIIHRTQEAFKKVTGLAGVTTQPVAGAQGEWVGLKLFQAYHRSRGEGGIRDKILIPKSAHGTNPATAKVAGFQEGILLVDADVNGEILLSNLETLLKEHGPRVAGIMITNPNTSGLFERNFGKIAAMIHAVGGLVYMDGANMNAVCGWADLGKLGVDAVHNNTHKTWSIPHGGGGPGDAFVAVSEKLLPFLPGIQVVEKNGLYVREKAPQSIGSFHRHEGNFAHKVRAYTYLAALGTNGVRRISGMAVLAARYLQRRLESRFDILPEGTADNPRMHEFIVTLKPALFAKIEEQGIPKSAVIGRFGKLFLDFGFHAPTVSFPEVYGLMIEPTESYTKDELDRFADAVLGMVDLVEEHPEVLLTVPHFTPIDRVDEVAANRNPVVSETLTALPSILKNRLHPEEIAKLPVAEIRRAVRQAHLARAS